MKLLVQYGADVNGTASDECIQRTALQAAAKGGHLAIVKYLTQNNADVNAAATRTRGGRTAL